MGIIGIEDAALDAVLNVRVWTTGDLGMFTDRASWINIVKNINQFVQPLIGDAILIYRCWVVYERRWIAVALSVLLWVGSCVVSTIFMVLAADVKSSSGVNASSLTPWVAASFSLTVVLNVITTSLITLRIWSVSRDIRPYIVGHNRITYFVRIIVESGLLYTTTAVIMLATSVAKTNADYIPGDVLVQMTGIAFNLIIIRFDHNLADRNMVQLTAASQSIPLSDLSHARPKFHIRVSQNTEIDKATLPGKGSDSWVANPST
ncbi:hypothetical protein CERSUDRAFT_118980 [Gelatoporia subvermispora B]|uniref:Uncharacterized protein n=1 Tax=Ceriporiopsis subvermispora (strain B) TaxID=914234 RepID=M2R093_CERS8|nr:hypothetical protein CERSUDRAFT_118980 [Gelatoporia subvermispora B]